jgi:dTDP-glucose pyrophosphorylase
VGELKVVVLARGLGTRMRDAESSHRADTRDDALTIAQHLAAAAGLKAMIPMTPGRPFLDYVLSSLADAGCRDIGLVIAPEHGSVRQYYRQEAPPERVRIHFIEQVEALGTANAVLASEAWVGDAAFLVLNADNLYPVQALRSLAALDGPGLPVFERDELVRSSNIPPERVASFALVHVGADGRLARIVEKPGDRAVAAAGPRALVSMNCWRFDRRIFDACRDVPRSARGEFELPMAVALALERGVPFTAIPASGAVLDLSRQQDIAAVAAKLVGVDARP